MRPDTHRGLRIHVHDAGARALESMRALIELATHPGPRDDTLRRMCRLAAELGKADVASVYLRDRRATGDVLVLAGNVGFPEDAVGRVELGVYEGLAGVVVERRRPVTVATAQRDRRYKHVGVLGEERFPAYLGVPLVHHEEVVGVLVLQRRRPCAFTATDVTLASSLTGPFLLAIPWCLAQEQAPARSCG